MTAEYSVLCVDDDFHIADLHAGFVARTPGFRAVGTVGTVRGALSLLASERPDLVLLDSYLPDGSGLDLVGRIDADVIMLTAANETASIRTALRRGAFSYLLKPFDPVLLTERLAGYAAYRAAVDAAGTLDQAGIDRTISARYPVRRQPQRIAPSTEQAILDEISTAAASMSAPEIADRLGVSRATAQRHLGALAGRRLVEVQLRYGVTGRPEHRYSLVRP